MKCDLRYMMTSFLIENVKPNLFFMLLELEHVTSNIKLLVREQYSYGRISVDREMLAETENSRNDLKQISDWLNLRDLGDLVGREVIGLDKLLKSALGEYFLPQLDELEDNAIANFELVDWFRQYGFSNTATNFEIKCGIKVLPENIKKQSPNNNRSCVSNFFEKPGGHDEREILSNEWDPRKFAKMHLKVLKGGHG